MADIGRGNYRDRRAGLDMADEIFEFLLVGIIGINGQRFGFAVTMLRQQVYSEQEAITAFMSPCHGP